MQIVAAADMHVIDEDLRKGRSAIGPGNHLVAKFGSASCVMLDKIDALRGQQCLGPRTITAALARIDRNTCHEFSVTKARM
ncbi:hypothetical protein D3C86_2040050 [compost metagenome]